MCQHRRVILAFAAAALLLTVALHGYVWWRVVRDTTEPGPWRRAGTLTLVALTLLVPGALVATRALPRHLGEPLGWIGYLWLAVLFYLLIALAVADLPRVLANRRIPSPSRRRFLARSLAAGSLAAAGGTVAYGVKEAAGPVGVTRVPVTLDKLDPALDGFTIGLIADVHLSAVQHGSLLPDVVHTLNGLKPGLVAVVGDLVDGTVAQLGHDAHPLADLRTQHGVYFVTGNHEYISGAEQWVNFLPSLGVRVLRNERIRIGQNGAAFDLAGIDDRTAASSGVPGHRANLGRALAGRDTSVPVVLLAHQPVMFADSAKHGVDLQLSGHTHGGQLAPFNWVVRLDQPVVAGRGRIGKSQLYVTRGVGTWGPPVRVGAPPEITLIELRAPR